MKSNPFSQLRHDMSEEIGKWAESQIEAAMEAIRCYMRHAAPGARMSIFDSDNENPTKVTSPTLKPIAQILLVRPIRQPVGPPALPLTGRMALLPFRPNRMLQEHQGLAPTLSAEQALHLFGTNYRGDITSNSFLAVHPNLPDHLNCALWIRNIPASAKAADVFEKIEFGAVYAFHLNPPTGIHQLAAAKLVFVYPKAQR